MAATAEVHELRPRGMPPRCTYASYKKIIRDLKNLGPMPRVINGPLIMTILGNGGEYGRGLAALRFLAHIDEAGKPLPLAQAAVDAYEGKEWAPFVQKMLRSAYPGVFALNLETCHVQAFHQKMKEIHTGNDDDGYRKAFRFFIAACKDAGIALGPQILTAKLGTVQRVKEKVRKATEIEKPAPLPQQEAPSTTEITPTNRPAHIELTQPHRFDLREYVDRAEKHIRDQTGAASVEVVVNVKYRR